MPAGRPGCPGGLKPPRFNGGVLPVDAAELAELRMSGTNRMPSPPNAPLSASWSSSALLPGLSMPNEDGRLLLLSAAAVDTPPLPSLSVSFSLVIVSFAHALQEQIRLAHSL